MQGTSAHAHFIDNPLLSNMLGSAPGVVSGCCCKEIYRFPHNNYFEFLPTPLVLDFLHYNDIILLNIAVVAIVLHYSSNM